MENGKEKTDILLKPPSLNMDDDAKHPVYRSIKFMLKKLRRSEDESKIEMAVRTCHAVSTLTLDFVKLYLEDLYVRGQYFPVLDEKFYDAVILVVTKPKTKQGRPRSAANAIIHDELLAFHTNHFLPLSPQGNKRIEVQNLSHVFDYLSQDMSTTQTTNITRNFPIYVKRFVNTYFLAELYNTNGWDKSHKMTKAEKSAFYGQLKHVKEDILFCRRWTDGYQSLPQYHEFLERCVGTLFPEPLDPTNEWGVYHDVRQRPFVYLRHMVDINIEFESRGVKLMSPFCLRSSLAPRYIKLDTAAIIDLLVTKDDIQSLSLKLPWLKKKNDFFGKNVSKTDNFTKLWQHIFKFDTNKHTRHLLSSNQGLYVFNNTILTDGVGVSVLQIRSDRVDYNCKANNSRALQVIEPDVPYLSELAQEERDSILRDDVVVGGDPGKKDIIYLIDQEGNKLRYTQQQRAVECRFKKNKKAMISMKKNTLCINGATVEEVERQITYNSKSCLPQATRDYIKKRRELEALVCEPLYNRDTIRKLRFSAKSHTIQSEDRLINRIVDKFQQKGKKAITIAWGNWGQRQQMKNCVSTPGVGLRKVLVRKGRTHGIKIGRENESCTSCTCHDCHGRTGYCKKRRFMKNGIRHTRYIHGLLRCQNESCSIRWNRNVLGATNILEVALATLQGFGRPAHFQIGHALEEADGGELRCTVG